MSKFPKSDPIWLVSNPDIVQRKAFEKYGQGAIITKSKAKDKKYSIKNSSGKLINFGNINYEDFTKHSDQVRREKYLKRSSGIHGNWKDNPYSPNNLSRYLLW